MFVIQVFNFDLEFLFTLPMPFRITEYAQMIEDMKVTQFIANDNGDIKRINTNALISLMSHWDESFDSIDTKKINRYVMTAVFTDPIVTENFMDHAMAGESLQIMIPVSDDENPSVQWTMLSPESLDAFCTWCADDAELSRLYFEQCDEMVALLENEEKKDIANSIVYPIQ